MFHHLFDVVCPLAYSVFSVFFFSLFPVINSSAPSVSKCSGYRLPSLSVCLYHWCVVWVSLSCPITLSCLLPLFLFLSSSLSHCDFSCPDFSRLVITLFSAFCEPIIQHHTSSTSIFCPFVSYSDQGALSVVYYFCHQSTANYMNWLNSVTGLSSLIVLSYGGFFFLPKEFSLVSQEA